MGALAQAIVIALDGITHQPVACSIQELTRNQAVFFVDPTHTTVAHGSNDARHESAMTIHVHWVACDRTMQKAGTIDVVHNTCKQVRS
jgi:hypothetical protein